MPEILLLDGKKIKFSKSIDGFEISKRNFANDKIDLDTLCDYSVLLRKAVDTEYISEENLLRALMEAQEKKQYYFEWLQ